MSANTPQYSTALELNEFSCILSTPDGPRRGVDRVSLRLERGSSLGVVGESGSGKSMLVRSMLGLNPSGSTLSGTVRLAGTDLSELRPRELRTWVGKHVGVVFQDPMTALNPTVRIGRQITEAMRKHLNIGQAEADRRAIELLDRVGLPDPAARMRQYPHSFSGGMRQRVMIAVALSCDPELLIADEATTALDVTLQKQILDLISEIRQERNMTLILISHDLGVISGHTDEVAVMYGGRMVERAPTQGFFNTHHHRYSEALFSSMVRPDHPRGSRFATIAGKPPKVGELEHCCPFAPRCDSAIEICHTDRPISTRIDAQREFSCRVPVALEPTHLDPVGGSQ